ncbi:Non-ribosomal peptide synthetase OS=Streptomyces antimycoticus OX=68175 GN=SANT12839_008100 PE=4 SV=1 [Streptomyces antimycoticus]
MVFGEALDARRLAGWYARHPETAPVLVNMYGITETTVHVTYAPLDRAAASVAAATGSAIGTAASPICGGRAWMQGLRPVPPGAVGGTVRGGGWARPGAICAARG